MEKEIRQDIKHLRESLFGKKRKLGPSPLPLQATIQWNQSLEEFEDKLRVINKKIDKFNMIVPILNKQKVHVNLQKEVNRTLENYGYGTTEENEIQRNSCDESKSGHKSKTLSSIRKLLETYRKNFLNRFAENGTVVAKELSVNDKSKE